MIEFPHPVLDAYEIGDKIIVVYKWDNLSRNSKPKIWENVECFDGHGNKLWTVNGMENDPYWGNKLNMFVGLNKSNTLPKLISFRGSSYDVNLVTGKISFVEFHK